MTLCGSLAAVPANRQNPALNDSRATHVRLLVSNDFFRLADNVRDGHFAASVERMFPRHGDASLARQNSSGLRLGRLYAAPASRSLSRLCPTATKGMPSFLQARRSHRPSPT